MDVKDYSSRLYAGETVLLKDIPMNTKGAIPVHGKFSCAHWPHVTTVLNLSTVVIAKMPY